jgi:hypothetical protein
MSLKYAVGNGFPHGYISFAITLVEIQQDKRRDNMLGKWYTVTTLLLW